MGRSTMRASTAAHGTLAALAALGLAACQDADVGQPCELDVYSGSPPVNIDAPVPGQQGEYCSADTADYFRSGAIECENLICIRSAIAGPVAGQFAACPDPSPVATYPDDVRKYCSKPCVADRDCENDFIKLVCRPIVLDSGYINFLQACAAGTATQDQINLYGPCPANAGYLLGSIPSSSYCATPST